MDYFLLVFLLSIPFWIVGGEKLPLPMNLPVSALIFINPAIAAPRPGPVPLAPRAGFLRHLPDHGLGRRVGLDGLCPGPAPKTVGGAGSQLDFGRRVAGLAYHRRFAGGQLGKLNLLAQSIFGRAAYLNCVDLQQHRREFIFCRPGPHNG